MAKKTRRYSKRRRSGGLSFVYKLLCFVAICGAIAVAMALFFKAENIRVEGNSSYTAQQITEASGIRPGDNLYLLNKYDAAESIIRTLPYVEQVQLRRQLPNTLVITVSECRDPVAIPRDGKLWLISVGGKVVGSAAAQQADLYPVISGISVSDPQVGYPIQPAEDCQKQCDALLHFLELLQERKMLQDITAIDMAEHDSISMSYLGRFLVVLPRDADWDYKLDYLLAVVDRLEANETGTIDMMTNGTASFIPQAKTASKASPGDLDPSAR